MTSTLLFLLLIFSVVPSVYGRNGGLISINTIGGTGIDKVYDIAATPDNGLILVGSTTSFDVDKEDIYVVKIDENGDMIWNRTYGEWESDKGYAVTRTRDNNYVITGVTGVTAGVGDDVLFLKINGDGGVISERNYGGNAWDWGCDVLEFDDGTFLLAGITEQFWMHSYDLYLVKTNARGDLIWKRRLAIDGNYELGACSVAPDGNIIMVGTIADLQGLDSNIHVIKVSLSGELIWTNTYGGDGKEYGLDLIDTGDGFLLLCKSETTAENEYDTSLLKINYDGGFNWSKSIGFPKDDFCDTIIRSGPNEFSLIGTSYGSDTPDIVLIKVNALGDVTLTETYGTSKWDSGKKIHLQRDKILIIGNTEGLNSNIIVIRASTTKASLNLVSEHGTPSGGGDYFTGSNVEIAINETAALDSKTRYFFTGWTDNSTGSMVGDSASTFYEVNSNTTLVAEWKTQYYVDIVNSSEVIVEPGSGWYDEDETIFLRATIKDDKKFIGWKGIGPGSYSGEDETEWLKVLGPIIQTPIVHELSYSKLSLESEHGQVFGEGTYMTGSNASFGVSPSIINHDEWTRYLFVGWESVYENGYNGNEANVTVLMKNDIIQTAVWERQYYVNGTVLDESTTVSGSGWYSEGEKVTLSCEGHGTIVDEWNVIGADDFEHEGNEITFTIKGPTKTWANTSEPESCFLNVISEYGETAGSTNSYIGAEVTFSVYPEVIDLTEHTRVIFHGWRSTSEYGYNGDENPVTMTMKGDTVQEAEWIRQFHIFSEENGINGWFDENTSITLDPHNEGSLISKHMKYSTEGEELDDQFKVTGPMNIDSVWSYSVTNLLIAAITSSSIGYTSYASMKRISGLRKKNQPEEEIIEEEEVEEIPEEEEKEEPGKLHKLLSLKERIKTPSFIPAIKRKINQLGTKTSGITEKVKAKLKREKEVEDEPSDSIL